MSQTAAPLAALDKITGHCHSALMQSQMAGRFAAEPSAKRAAETATEELRAALRGLKNAGGRLPDAPSSAASDLSGLASLSTPSSASLLALLREARNIAERVNAERGRVAGKSSPDDVAGTDLAEALHFLILRVADEVEGPKSERGE